jgi:cytochrome P450
VDEFDHVVVREVRMADMKSAHADERNEFVGAAEPPLGNDRFGRIAVTDLPRLPFSARVFAEALRLYPPASAFGRRALEACTLGGFAICLGDGILLSPYVSHRNPAVFAAPEAFVPDRWSAAPPPPFGYFPFGGGSRMCIGEAFARMEGTLVLS